ncbi:MAG: Mur ligase family protein [Fimbriimonadaceae bacterium]
MDYESALAYVASLAPRGWRFGLDRMTEFARRASFVPPDDCQFVHIAGTNGKGSVTAYVQSLFVELGFKTGAFFSPYVYDPRERVQLGRDLIAEEDFARIVTQLIPFADSFSETEFGGITEFEFKTAVGFQFWNEKGCKRVALEVGLGGKLDATNIIETSVPVIVSIGLDHTSILGNTIREIATEKAGIIKQTPAICGLVSDEARSVIRQAANNDVIEFGRDIFVEDNSITTPRARYEGLTTGVKGKLQMHNAALAIAAVEVMEDSALDPAAVSRAIASAKVPGRFEVRDIGGQTWILDGAHNRAAAQVLAGSLPSGLILLTNMVAGHDALEFYEPILPFVEQVIVCPIDFHRAREVDEIVALLREVCDKPITPTESVADAVRVACGLNSPVLVTGSFYLVGEVGRHLSSD